MSNPRNYASETISIIADLLGLEESSIAIDKSLSDLGADSLDAVDLMMELEDKFDIEITEEYLKKWNTVADILDYIEAKASAPPPLKRCPS